MVSRNKNQQGAISAAKWKKLSNIIHDFYTTDDLSGLASVLFTQGPSITPFCKVNYFHSDFYATGAIEGNVFAFNHPGLELAGARFLSYYADKDPGKIERIKPANANSSIRMSDLLSPSQHHRDEFVVDFLYPNGVKHMITTTLWVSGRPLVFGSISRMFGEKDFSDKDVATINLLIPHMANAIAGAEKRKTLSEIQNPATTGGVTSISSRQTLAWNLGMDLKLIWSNAGPGALFAETGRKRSAADGLGDTVIFPAPVQRMLVEMKGQWEKTRKNNEFYCPFSQALTLSTRDKVFVFKGTIVTSSDGEQQKASILLLADLVGSREPLATLFESLGRLTRREQEVAMLALKGFGNATIAENLFIAHQTAKEHMSSIYRKLKVKNRAEFISTYERLSIY